MTRVLIVSIGVAMVLMMMPAKTAAQMIGEAPRPERPYRGLFGGGVGSAEQLLSFNATFSTGAIRGTRRLESDTLDLPMTTTRFDQGSLSLNYKLNKTRVGFNAFAGLAAVHYPDQPQDLILRHSFGAGASFSIVSTQRTTLGVTESLSYGPRYLPAALPNLFGPVSSSGVAQSIALGQDAGPKVEDSLSTNTGIGFTRGITKRIKGYAGYNFERSISPSHELDVNNQFGSAGVRVALFKTVGLRLGYTFTRAAYYNNQEPLFTQSFDVGIDFNYNKGIRIPLSRKVSVTFNGGVATSADRLGFHVYLVGSAVLDYEIGRTWRATLEARRNLSVLTSFTQPALTNDLVATFGGFITRKVQFHSNVGTTKGSIGSGGLNGLASTYASAGFQLGLVRNLALGLDYSFYVYDFQKGVAVPIGYSRYSNQRVAIIQLTYWAPLFMRHGRTNASR